MEGLLVEENEAQIGDAGEERHQRSDPAQVVQHLLGLLLLREWKNSFLVCCVDSLS